MDVNSERMGHLVDPNSPIPVLIAGAGPTGLSMAIELHRYGIPFRIFDKHRKPVPTSNALAVQTRTLEIWDDLGFLDVALDRGIPVYGASIFSKKKEIAHISLNLLKSSFHFLLALSQHQTEAMLLEHLASKDIFVEFEKKLTDLVCLDNGIEATLSNNEGNTELIRADWLIASDGAHSYVREKCGVSFYGKDLPQHFVLADLEIESTLKTNQLNLFTSAKGILAIIPFDQKYSRIIADVTYDPELKEAKALTYSQVQRLISERCAIPLKISEPLWTSGFWIRARRVEDFQRKNVFFAGDAAHIHSPVGGQGMNTGIQDANNLAWKLAWVIQQKAHPSILTTYNSERGAVAKEVLKRTTAFTSLMTTRNAFLQKCRNGLMSWLLKFQSVQRLFVNTLAQLSIHYPKNLLVVDCLGKQAGPKAGTKMLDVNELLFESVHGAKLSLLFFMGEKDQADISLFYDLESHLKKLTDLPIVFSLIRAKDEFVDWQGYKIFDVDTQLHKLYGAYEPRVYVIRPDKYIGFRGGLNHLDKLKKWLIPFSYNLSYKD